MDSGAHFHRADLQVHSPRDGNWKGSRPSTDAEREAYARDFIAACRDKGLQAVAITDHHDVAFIDVIREAARAELLPDGSPVPGHAQIVVFPGVELTLSVPCQALLLLDADFPADRLNDVLTVISVTQSDPAAQKSDDPVAIPHIDSLQKLHETLDQNDWLRGKYIVLPNVTDGGHQTLIRKGMQQNYISMPCHGGYTDGAASKLGNSNRAILAGEASEWGNKRVAVIQTSDARDREFKTLGVHSTWIKWSEPSAEALRQAFLAQESRISLESPDLPDVVVTRMSVSNSKFMGPIELELNPQYNAVIGGRGTGKSTCLEYLRWAMCDQPAQPQAADEIPDHASRRDRLISQTLEPLDASVDVHLEVNGIAHVVRRYAKSKEVWISVAGGEFEQTTPEDVRALLPVQAYSQKQLSSVGVRLEELRRFITAPIREQLDALQTREQGAIAKVRENFVVLQRQRALTRSTARDELLIKSIDEQAVKLREGLGGISDADKAVLAQKPGFDAGQKRVDTWTRRAERISEAADEFLELVARVEGEFPATADHSEVSEKQLIEAIEAAVKKQVAAVKAQAQTAVDGATQLEELARNGSEVQAWNKKRDAFDVKYKAATERSTAHKSKLDQLAEIDKRKKELQAALDKNKDELNSLKNAQEAHANLRSDWRSLQSERSDLVQARCEALTELSSGLIRAKTERNAGFDDFEARFKSAIGGSNVRSAKVEAFIERVSKADDPLVALHSSLDDLEAVVLTKDDPGSAPKSVQSELNTFSDAEIAKMAERLTPEALLDLSLISIEDRPEFEYRTKDGEYIAFDDASAGQQATALLGALLSQSGPPLVIDQPEEDLDSQVILDVVDKIWQAKRRRQLIFSSHNANLVVNGDAELVVCCDYRVAGDQSGGKIKLQGAIDNPDMRDEITVVMEGGERAFKLRKEKYGF